ncbi:MAG: hypothetical protein EOO38_25480, partial [Cytophagaceae bacterium]
MAAISNGRQPTPVPGHPSLLAGDSSRRLFFPSNATSHRNNRVSEHDLKPRSDTPSTLSSSVGNSSSSWCSSSTSKTSPPGSIELPLDRDRRRQSQSQYRSTLVSSSGITDQGRGGRQVQQTSLSSQQRPTLKRTKGQRDPCIATEVQTPNDKRVNGASARPSVQTIVSRSCPTQATSPRPAKSSILKSTSNGSYSRQNTSAKRASFSIPEAITEESEEYTLSLCNSSKTARHDSAGDKQLHIKHTVLENSKGAAVSDDLFPDFASGHVAERVTNSATPTSVYRSWGAPRPRNE